MYKINCFGEICPIPLLKLKNAIKDLASGEAVMLVVDHSCVVESIADYYDTSKNEIEYEEVLNGVWEITVTKF